ncbi:MAG: isoprenylcysteine carboxylmethyltransferase family protein [Alphaproteobacteria bacterium]
MNDAVKDSPGVIAPPPLIVLGALAVTLGLDGLWPAPLLDSTIQVVAGGGVLAAGLALVATCVRLFVRAGTNVPTYRPTTVLVTEGPYRISRNPIYVGLLLGTLGIAVLVDSAWMIGGVVPLFAVLDIGVIAREESYLERKFGADYRAYKAKVRRWL